MRKFDNQELVRIKKTLKSAHELRPSETALLMDYIYELELTLYKLVHEAKAKQAAQMTIQPRESL